MAVLCWCYFLCWEGEENSIWKQVRTLVNCKNCQLLRLNILWYLFNLLIVTSKLKHSPLPFLYFLLWCSSTVQKFACVARNGSCNLIFFHTQHGIQHLEMLWLLRVPRDVEEVRFFWLLQFFLRSSAVVSICVLAPHKVLSGNENSSEAFCSYQLSVKKFRPDRIHTIPHLCSVLQSEFSMGDAD